MTQVEIGGPAGPYYLGSRAMLEAVRAGRITPSAALLLDIICAQAGPEGYCALSDRELGEWLGGMSRRQVIKLRAMLVAAGLLEERRDEQDGRRRRLMPRFDGEVGAGGGGPAVPALPASGVPSPDVAVPPSNRRTQ